MHAFDRSFLGTCVLDKHKQAVLPVISVVAVSACSRQLPAAKSAHNIHHLHFSLLLVRSVEKALYQSDSDGSNSILEQLLPAKAGDLELAKLPAPSRLVIYLLDGIPVLVDTSGKSDFVPTAMGLWSCPQLLPQVTVKHPAVSQFILSGRCTSHCHELLHSTDLCCWDPAGWQW